MPSPTLSREEQMVAFFVNECSGSVGRTRLMKLLYLADYESRRYLGRAISTINYIWHDYGPFDSNLYSWLESLQSQGLIQQQRVPAANGNAYVYSPAAIAPSHDFTEAELDILNYVRREYSQRNFRELLDDIVYETEPMLKAKAENAQGKVLDMQIVDREKAKDFLAPYEDLLARSRGVRKGDVVSHETAMARLSQLESHAAA